MGHSRPKERFWEAWLARAECPSTYGTILHSLTRLMVSPKGPYRAFLQTVWAIGVTGYIVKLTGDRLCRLLPRQPVT